jgi:histidinol-phosphate aminotransferase
MISPNEHLLAIERVIERMDERSAYVRLDRNERVNSWPESVFRDMLASLKPEQFCSYPDPSPLYARLSRNLGVPEDHLYLSNGSDAAIRLVFQAFVRPGDTVLLPDPTYAMYPIYTRIFRGQCDLVPYDERGHLEIGRIVARLRSRPRIVALANPDQPSGAVLSESALREVAAAARETNTLFVIDEAYYPFFPQTALALIRDFENVVITRTFSKFGGLAGLRIGHLVARPEVIGHVQRIRGAHEVNAMAIAMASYVLDHPELGRANLEQIESGRSVLAAAARELGLGFPYCPANFQLLRFVGVGDTGPLCAALKQLGYLVKGSFTAPCVRDCIRVTLAGPDVMAGFVAALRNVAMRRSEILTAG